MACIKCGKATASGAEFCEDCLAEMSHYPVKRDTPVILPNREEHAATKHTKKKAVKPEVQVLHLKKKVGWLRAISIILFLLLAVAGVLIWALWDEAIVTSLLTQ